MPGILKRQESLSARNPLVSGIRKCQESLDLHGDVCTETKEVAHDHVGVGRWVGEGCSSGVLYISFYLFLQLVLEEGLAEPLPLEALKS